MECPFEPKSIKTRVQGPAWDLLLEDRGALHFVSLSRVHGARLAFAVNVRSIHTRWKVWPDGQQLPTVDAKGCYLHSHSCLSHLCQSSGKYLRFNTLCGAFDTIDFNPFFHLKSSQKEFNDHRDETNEDVGDIFGLPGFDIDTNEEGINVDIDNINDLFNDDNWADAGGQPGSPRSPSGMRNDISQPNSPGSKPNASDQFRYGQEEPDERIEILQQPLALGYMVSTAKTGPMPRWFWASCPHLEHTSPVFLKSALHINVASLSHGGDDGFAPASSSGRVHSLDSTYTADVLR